MIKHLYAFVAVMHQRANATQLANTASDKAIITTTNMTDSKSQQNLFYNEHGSIDSIDSDRLSGGAVLTNIDHEFNNWYVPMDQNDDAQDVKFLSNEQQSTRMLQGTKKLSTSPNTPFSKNAHGLELANKLSNVTQACLTRTCGLDKKRTTTQSMMTMHHDIQNIWTFYSLEESYGASLNEGKIGWEQSLVLSQSMRETQGGKNEFGAGLPFIHEQEDIEIFKDAKSPSIWYIGDTLVDPILIAFEKIDDKKGNSLAILQYANFEFLKMNIYSDMIHMPRSKDSASDGNPSITDVTWSGNIQTSSFEMIYTYQNSSGGQTIAKGIYKYDPSEKRYAWKTYPQKFFNGMYQSKGLVDSFGQMHQFMYDDKYYFITEAKVLNETSNFVDNHILLCDGSFTPITLLPIEIPEHLGNMQNFSAPSISRVNNTLAVISFRHNEWDQGNGKEEFSQFIYFVDLVGTTAKEEEIKYPEYSLPRRRESVYIQIVSSITSFFTKIFFWQ